MHVHSFFLLSYLLLEDVLADTNPLNGTSTQASTSPRWTRLDENNFEMSSCAFSDSDFPSDYFCYDPEGVYIENTVNKPPARNTFEITETLCDHRHHGLCRNISLFFFKSQTVGLCVSSSSDLIQAFVALDFDDYYRYLPTCIMPDSELQYAGGFSCKKLDDKSRKLIFTVKGYDLLNSDVWSTTLTVKIVGNCSLTSHDLSDIYSTKADATHLVSCHVSYCGSKCYNTSKNTCTKQF